ncbi:hypothetical protein JW848_08880 [Candidatus Bipolaricaulota bacterium]|nr:hypothetical protein [Candidatus Bipolaricaulota bacterium]
MNSQNVILIALGIFLSVLVGLTAYSDYIEREHDPMDPGGLVWRTTAALAGIQDLDTRFEITDNASETTPIQLIVRYVAGVDPALYVQYVAPEVFDGEIFTVDGDLLSHYIPREDTLVIQRWTDLPVANAALVALDLRGLMTSQQQGNVDLRVLRDTSSGIDNTFDLDVPVSGTISGTAALPAFTAFGLPAIPARGIAMMNNALSGIAIPGGYILEVTDRASGELSQMIWIDDQTFLITKILQFDQGMLTTTIRLQRPIINSGLTREEILNIPRAGTTLRI